MVMCTKEFMTIPCTAQKVGLASWRMIRIDCERRVENLGKGRFVLKCFAQVQTIRRMLSQTIRHGDFGVRAQGCISAISLAISCRCAISLRSISFLLFIPYHRMARIGTSRYAIGNLEANNYIGHLPSIRQRPERELIINHKRS